MDKIQYVTKARGFVDSLLADLEKGAREQFNKAAALIADQAIPLSDKIAKMSYLSGVDHITSDLASIALKAAKDLVESCAGTELEGEALEASKSFDGVAAFFAKSSEAACKTVGVARQLAKALHSLNIADLKGDVSDEVAKSLDAAVSFRRAADIAKAQAPNPWGDLGKLLK